eukprot:GHVS01078366.1.p1 GENE.GHVS01078366.1~~GHVS01078366.1.p1  ORF type:complete len:515 (+),score=10.50 GHVS01078366.1:136-1680(+)
MWRSSTRRVAPPCDSHRRLWRRPGKWIMARSVYLIDLVVGFVAIVCVSSSIALPAKCSPASTVKAPMLRKELVSNSWGLRRFSSLLYSGVLKQTLPNRFVFRDPPNNPFGLTSAKSVTPAWLPGLNAVTIYTVVNDQDQMLLARSPVGRDDEGPISGQLRENLIGLFFVSYRDCRIFMENLRRTDPSSSTAGTRIRAVTLAHYFDLTRRLRQRYMRLLYPSVCKSNGLWTFIRNCLIHLTRASYRNRTGGRSTGEGMATSAPASTTTLLIVPDMQELSAARSYPSGRQPVIGSCLIDSNTIWDGQGTPVFVVTSEKSSPGPQFPRSSTSTVGLSRRSRKPGRSNVRGSVKLEEVVRRQPEVRTTGTTVARETALGEVDSRTEGTTSSSKNLRLFLCHKDAELARKHACATQGLFGGKAKVVALSLEALLNEFERYPEKYGDKTIEFVQSAEGEKEGRPLQIGRSSGSGMKLGSNAIKCGADLSCMRRFELGARKFIAQLVTDWRVLFGIEVPPG